MSLPSGWTWSCSEPKVGWIDYFLGNCNPYVFCASSLSGYATYQLIASGPSQKMSGERRKDTRETYENQNSWNREQHACYMLFILYVLWSLLPLNDDLCAWPCAKYIAHAVSFNFLTHPMSSFIFWLKQVTRPVQIQGWGRDRPTSLLDGRSCNFVGVWIKRGTIFCNQFATAFVV